MFLFSTMPIFRDYYVRVSYPNASLDHLAKFVGYYFECLRVTVLSTTSFVLPAFVTSVFAACKFLSNKVLNQFINLPFIMHSNAATTFELSSAEVSSKAIYSFSANTPASSYCTYLSFSKSDLFPISIKTIFSAPWSRSSLSHFSTFSKLCGLVIS